MLFRRVISQACDGDVRRRLNMIITITVIINTETVDVMTRFRILTHDVKIY